MLPFVRRCYLSELGVNALDALHRLSCRSLMALIKLQLLIASIRLKGQRNFRPDLFYLTALRRIKQQSDSLVLFSYLLFISLLTLIVVKNVASDR